MLTLYICITELHLLSLTLFFNYIYVLLRYEYISLRSSQTHTHTDEETNTRQCVCTVKQPTYWITHFYSCLNAVVCRRAIPKQHLLFCVLYYCSYYRHLLALQFAFLCLLLSFYIHSGSHRTDMTILCLSCDKTAANSLNSLHTLYIVSLQCATTYSRHVRLRISPLRLPSSYVSSLSVSGAVSI